MRMRITLVLTPKRDGRHGGCICCRCRWWSSQMTSSCIFYLFGVDRLDPSTHVWHEHLWPAREDHGPNFELRPFGRFLRVFHTLEVLKLIMKTQDADWSLVSSFLLGGHRQLLATYCTLQLFCLVSWENKSTCIGVPFEDQVAVWPSGRCRPRFRWHDLENHYERNTWFSTNATYCLRKS